ncbi:hypothetical protein UA08_04902 [Talaromyces atroroseus]|uniref:Uncharacterized protein n=1 Tax=Talaromyces atroroseus TaxID=1441469 RepID=A0A225ASA1_TALAT|nr:hypothetical protein UA08_04902 [Talaromyces atroroseus]OKL60158.1 hypothetical protein UA08_04902 [Talaromyces atroroseus]
MASSPSVSTSSIHSHAPDERGPHFRLQDCPPDEPVIIVQPNEALLLPLSQHSLHRKLEVTAHQSLQDLSIGSRSLADDLIMLTSSAGVIFGRIPNELSDVGFTKWLELFIDYISHNEQASWWHTDYSGPWACYVFVPMNKRRTKWMYPNTKNGRSRPLTILGMLDTYAETKSWQLRLPGWEHAEDRVAEIRGKCYVPALSNPKQRKRRQDTQHRPKQLPREGWRPSTEIRFVWDPVEQIRELRLRDQEWTDELVLERVEMSLI